MEVLNLATDWARAETITSAYFILFGILSIIASIGFWRLGKTKMAKAYIFPTLIAGILLLLLGGGLFNVYYSSIEGLALKYNSDPSSFIAKEIARTDAGIVQYKNDLFGLFPFIMMASALLTIVIKRRIWRAIFITVLALSTVIMLVDSHAIALLEAYNASLKQF